MEEPNGPATLVYALPLPEAGSVQVRRRGRAGSVSVRAHGSAVACLALSGDGRLLATAGTRGTLVRIFSTPDGTKLQEVCTACLKAVYSFDHELLRIGLLFSFDLRLSKAFKELR